MLEAVRRYGERGTANRLRTGALKLSGNFAGREREVAAEWRLVSMRELAVSLVTKLSVAAAVFAALMEVI
jgi:hypothetical protein